jgi:hypothetical protein
MNNNSNSIFDIDKDVFIKNKSKKSKSFQEAR